MVRILRVGGRRVVVHTRGAGGAVFVLVPGLGMAHRYFAPLAGELAAGATVHTVHVLDGARTDREATITDLADTVWRTLDRLAVERPVLVGHSMGSQVVVEMACCRPGAARGVVLLAPVANPEERSGWLQAVRLWTSSVAETPRANWIVVSDSVRCGVPSLLRRLHALLAYPMEDRISGVDAPLVIMRGEHDQVVPRRWAEDLCRRTPSATLVEVPGEGHIIMFTSPQVVAERCRAVC